MCNYFVIPINVGYSKKGIQWNYFSEMPKKELNRVETFLYDTNMKTGDYVFLYITKKGLSQINTKESQVPGVYAIGRILSSSPQKMEDQNDRNVGDIVIQVDLEYYNTERPLANFPDSVKPKPHGRPFIINDIDDDFIEIIETAKSNAKFKPII